MLYQFFPQLPTNSLHYPLPSTYIQPRPSFSGVLTGLFVIILVSYFMGVLLFSCSDPLLGGRRCRHVRRTSPTTSAECWLPAAHCCLAEVAAVSVRYPTLSWCRCWCRGALRIPGSVVFCGRVEENAWLFSVLCWGDHNPITLCNISTSYSYFLLCILSPWTHRGLSHKGSRVTDYLTSFLS